jgi:hypothetical protein
MVPGVVVQHLIFFVSYKLAQKARMSHYSGLEMFAFDKYSSVLGPFVNFKENKVLLNTTPELNFF